MRKKRLSARTGVLSLLLLLCIPALFAQNKLISGKVTDSKDGNPVQGVTVTSKGSRSGTTTDENGNFRLSVSNATNVLVFSSIGFTQKEVPITGTNLTVSLTAFNASLNEVIVVAY